MADNLCGPSTALKSFSEHVNRDRSVHQDRAAPGRAGPSNFRSAPNGTHSNEAEARAFAAGGAAFQAEPMMVPDMNGHVHPAAFQQMGQMGPHAHHPQARFAGPGGVAPGHANGASNSNNWATEFALSGTATHVAAPAGPSPAAAAAARAPYAPQQPLQAVNRLQHFSSGMMAQSPAFLSSMNQPSFAGTQQFSQFNYSSPSSSYAPQPAALTTSTSTTTTMPHIAPPSLLDSNAPSGVAGLTEAELEARFAEAESNFDFQNEMDAWMQQHGPTAEERGETSAAQTEDVDAILESLADELDAQRLAESTEAAAALDAATADAAAADETAAAEQAEQDLARDQDDLARTAGQIVHTLDAHPSTKFQESSFMRLMKRIQTREVTVQGDNLVDEATGQPIEQPVRTEMAPMTTTTATTTTTAAQESETTNGATA
ncbi:hypothetical protein SPBR_01686 [Sporothrix brasiliensis 5110]|uniref:Peroxin 20 n=1 Tax=Sporothrix brasiliensis 5110 TaxID=1398154 RepID=A0A0C2EXC3_9PEZI|nr:uncharacterized protein SPBR_01686 [Sporothrix brasiliensis 5110]KIH91239.1 hypothetical protein SPBR_01686 [Sporothrix brasiliensis 5110]